MVEPSQTTAAPSAAWETRYRHSRRRLLVVRLRLGAVLAAILVPGSFVLEVFAWPAYTRQFLGLRLAYGLVALGFWWLARLRNAERWAPLLTYAIAIVLAAGAEVLLVRGPGIDSSYYAAHIIILVAVGLLFPWSPAETLGVVLGVLGVYLSPLLFEREPVDARVLANNVYFILTAGILLVVASVFTARLRRREFFSRLALVERTRALDDATARLETSLQRLKEIDRARSRFFAQVSHELRTPLTLVLAPLEEVRSDWNASLPDPVAHRLDLVHKSAARLLDLVDRLLDLSRLQAGKAELRPALVDLDAFAGTLLDLFQPFARNRSVELVYEGTGELLVEADPEKLESILRNLVSNAVKFTPKGGQVRLTLRSLGDDALIEVSDTGIGIAPERQRDIFDLFSRVEDPAGGRTSGSGIGLAVVKELVDLHGGTIELTSRPGQGSTFRVTLRKHAPGAEAESVLRAPPGAGAPDVEDEPLELLDAGTPRPGRRESERILVIEDNDTLRTFLESLLGRYYDVVSAPDAERGMELARSARPDLVLCDVMLPGASGFEFTETLKGGTGTAAVPVVLLTARRGTEALVEGLSRGADDWVEKPFHAEALLARVRAHLRRRSLSRELAAAQRLSLLGTVAAGVVHEVRTPVAAIKNGVEVLSRELAKVRDVPGPAREVLELLIEAADRVTGLVQDLGWFAQVEDSEPVDWDPNEGVRRAMRILDHRKGHVDVAYALEWQGRVRGHAGRLEQVLVNLVDNALRAAGPEGRLVIRSEAVPGGLRLSVEDDGPGIDAEVLPRIFEPFFTTRSRGEGTGLGLYLSRGIVEAHGGTLEARNRPEGGAVFELWLPARPAPRAAEA